MSGPIPPGAPAAGAGYGYGRGPGGGHPGGNHPGTQFGNPEMTPAQMNPYQTPGFPHPGHPPSGFGLSGVSPNPPPSGIHAPPTDGYRRWTPGSTGGAPAGGNQSSASTNPGYNPNSVPMTHHTGGYPGGGPNTQGTASRSNIGMRAPPSNPPSLSMYAPRPQSASGPPSYDVVHLSARNARLEEKLSKALAKNRSMAKYYDTLLAKTRDAQEREVEELKSELARVVRNAAEVNLGGRGGDGADDSSLTHQLREERTHSQKLQRELDRLRREGSSNRESNSEELTNTAAALRVATEQLSMRDAELATLRSRIAENNSAMVEGSQTGFISTQSGSAGGQTLTQMRDLLDQAREERTRERRDAERRDAEMANQLTDIKEQALERIKESTAAAREVATLKERCHASELERDRLRDKVQELEHDERDHRELRRMARDAEQAAKNAKEKADRCELAEARLRQEQAHVASLRDERAQAHARTQEMTERLLNVTNEKDVLVRHSARQVHVEAELANCKEELEHVKKSGLITKAEAKEETSVWRDGAEGLGRVLRSHIYGHARWERLVSDECAAASDAHEHGQRSTVRLVAAAEQEAAGLAGEAIEVVRATRQLLQEYGQECAATVVTIKKQAKRDADERVEAALDMLHEAEQRAAIAESDAAAQAADARRARAAAQRAGVLPSALAVPEPDPNDSNARSTGSGSVNDLMKRSNTNANFRRQLRQTQFQIFGLAMWKKASEISIEKNQAFLRGQLELSRRETRVAMAQLEQSERSVDVRTVSTKWGLLASGVLRKNDKDRRDAFDDIVSALQISQKKLLLSDRERLSSNNALKRADDEISKLHRTLQTLQQQHDDALRRLQNERRLRGELGQIVRGDNQSGFDDMPSVRETHKAMDGLYDSSKHASELAKQAAEDVHHDPSGTAPHGAREQLEATLTACHDALLIMADEDDAAERLRRAEKERVAVGLETNKTSSSHTVASEMDTATRRVRRRAIEIKAELVAALLDGITSRQEVVHARREANVSDEKICAFRAENAAARMMRFARQSKVKREAEGSLGNTPEKTTSYSQSRKDTETEKTGDDRFGGVASGYTRAARAARTWSASAQRKSAQSSLDFEKASDVSKKDDDDKYDARYVSRKSTEDDRPKVSHITRQSVTTDADANSDPNQFSQALASKRVKKVVHSPVQKSHQLRRASPIVARGGGVDFTDETADRSYASLLKARAKRADALAQRSVNDGTLDEMKSKTRDQNESGQLFSQVSETKKKGGWLPPPWDETPLRKSHKKSQGVSPYTKSTKITKW